MRCKEFVVSGAREQTEVRWMWLPVWFHAPAIRFHYGAVGSNAKDDIHLLGGSTHKWKTKFTIHNSATEKYDEHFNALWISSPHIYQFFIMIIDVRTDKL